MRIDGQIDPHMWMDVSLWLQGVDVVAEEPDAGPVSAAAAAAALDGSPRWVPYLVDVVPLVFDEGALVAIFGALEALSGLPAPEDRVEAHVAFGSWMISRGIDAGSHYPRWKSRLYSHFDPAFEALLSQVTDPVLATAFQWGGVPVGGIPELNQPDVIPAAEAEFMTAKELVFGAVVGGHVRAYPLRIMDFHELANDELGGTRIVLADCTLCRSGTLFERAVGDQILDFATSGLLFNSNKVMVDAQTSTLWQQLTGTALAGPLAGTKLEPLLLTTTTWEDWLAEHPETEVLDLPDADVPAGIVGGFSYEPGDAYSDYYSTNALWFPAGEAPDVLDAKAEVAGIVVGDASLAVSLDALAEHGPLVTSVGGSAVVVVPTGGGARFYEGLADERELADATAGELELTLSNGQSLPRLRSGQSFWFAWWGVHPDTQVWP